MLHHVLFTLCFVVVCFACLLCLCAYLLCFAYFVLFCFAFALLLLCFCFAFALLTLWVACVGLLACCLKMPLFYFKKNCTHKHKRNLPSMSQHKHAKIFVLRRLQQTHGRQHDAQIPYTFTAPVSSSWSVCQCRQSICFLGP